MTGQAGPPPKLFVKAAVAVHNFLFRISGGRVGGRFAKAPVLLLSVKGRKSGRVRTVPVLYLKTERGYALVASFAGSPKHPDWYLNLEAAGVADIRLGGSTMRARVEIPDPDGERYRSLWQQAVALYPDYAVYQTRTTRRIPVVELVLIG